MTRKTRTIPPSRPPDKPVGFMRRWAFDRIDVMKIPKKDRPRGWYYHEVSATRMLPDDVPLYHRETAREEYLCEVCEGPFDNDFGTDLCRRCEEAREWLSDPIDEGPEPSTTTEQQP